MVYLINFLYFLGMNCCKDEIMNLIIDTDGGVDDLFAIYLLIHNEKCKIQAITCSYGNVNLESN